MAKASKFTKKDFSDGIRPKPTSLKHEMIFRSKAKIVFFGGAAGGGKSYTLLSLPTLRIHNKYAKICFVRKTKTDMQKNGALFDAAKDLYSSLPTAYRPKVNNNAMTMIFPSGAKAIFMGCQDDRDLDKFQGTENDLILIDEAPQLEFKHILNILSRARSKVGSGLEAKVYMAGNPLPNSEIKDFISWYLDEDGYPIEERMGIVRYFINNGGSIIWADTEQELRDKYPRLTTGINGEDLPLLSFTFIQITLKDNPHMLKANPEYVAYLNALSEQDKNSLMKGCWNSVDNNGVIFTRNMLKEVDDIPKKSIRVRAWDKAATERKETNRTPDFTASIGMAYSDGNFYLYGNYCDDNYDEETKTYGRFCKNDNDRDRIIRYQAYEDGRNVRILFPIDAGAAGAFEFRVTSSDLQKLGFTVDKDRLASNIPKLKKFKPFEAACKSGKVYIVKSSFDERTLEKYLEELERFDGKRSTASKKDDWCDCTATAFNYLVQFSQDSQMTLEDLNTISSNMAIKSTNNYYNNNNFIGSGTIPAPSNMMVYK